MFLKMQNETGTFEILESKVIKDNYVTNCVKKIGPTWIGQTQVNLSMKIIITIESKHIIYVQIREFIITP